MRLDNAALQTLIANRLNEFYRRRLYRLNTLQLKAILRRKNPHLFKAVGTQSATEIVEGISTVASRANKTISSERFSAVSPSSARNSTRYLDMPTDG